MERNGPAIYDAEFIEGRLGNTYYTYTRTGNTLTSMCTSGPDRQ